MTPDRPRLRAPELALLADLIELRDRSQLAGRQGDEFAIVFMGDDGDLTHPSFSGSRKVSMHAMRRYRQLQLLDFASETDAAWTFDLVDGIHDRLDVLRRDAGLPSEIGEAEARASRAEGSVAELEEQEEARRANRVARARRDARRITRVTASSAFLAALAATVVNLLGHGSGVVTAIGITLAVLMLVDYFFGHSAVTLSHRFEDYLANQMEALYKGLSGSEM